MSTPYHAKYYASELTKQAVINQPDKLSMSLFDSAVDLNPHQIEAALFAFHSPLTKGVILADEVGLGKTIEAGLVLCQLWAERKRKLIIVCPASLRKQWSQELYDKFNLPSIILDSKSYREAKRNGIENPFDRDAVIISSFNFIKNKNEEVKLVGWDLAVIDEAHKLRNVYRSSNKIGKGVKWALEGVQKILLTATPLQNSLLELYGLSTLIDEHIFGDLSSFREQFINAGGDLEGLRRRLQGFCHRTLRSQVVEYVSYTERRAITRPFTPSDREQRLYNEISQFLQREDTYSIPKRQRTLTSLILRKLLASSSIAIAGTLETMKSRLQTLLEQSEQNEDNHLFGSIVAENEIEDEWTEAFDQELPDYEQDNDDENINVYKIKEEIMQLDEYIGLANAIEVDTKTKALMSALTIGFEEMNKVGANRKALIFTESRRTQEYLFNYLRENGYDGKVIMFNGSNSDPTSKEIYHQWLENNRETGRITGSKSADQRAAIIDYFRDQAEIMIATESAAEGVNLQFCSLVINYDLPWNPQRIEQRIGRCHRYGQKHDVVVINFLNQRNEADQRVYQLLAEKFNLFSGLFGASDEVLGTIESVVDFEKRVLSIYQECRTTDEIEQSFQALQQEMEQEIKSRIVDTRRAVLEHFDEDVHARLKVHLDETQARLDRFGKLFWGLTKIVLAGQAEFDDQSLCFNLYQSPIEKALPGQYQLISKSKKNVQGHYLYRLSHPLGEYVIDEGKSAPTPPAEIVFDITNHPVKISVVEALKGKRGYLILSKLVIESFDKEEHCLFNAFTDDGEVLDQETCEKLFQCQGKYRTLNQFPAYIKQQLLEESRRHARAKIHQTMERDNEFFQNERERLDKWADDLIVAAEKELKDIKVQIRKFSRESRLATSLSEQRELQTKIRDLERKQRKKRKEIFDIEDDILEKRDQLIDDLEKKMIQQTTIEPLFIIRWTVQ